MSSDHLGGKSCNEQCRREQTSPLGIVPEHWADLDDQRCQDQHSRQRCTLEGERGDQENPVSPLKLRRHASKLSD